MRVTPDSLDEKFAGQLGPGAEIDLTVELPCRSQAGLNVHTCSGLQAHRSLSYRGQISAPLDCRRTRHGAPAYRPLPSVAGIPSWLDSAPVAAPARSLMLVQFTLTPWLWIVSSSVTTLFQTRVPAPAVPSMKYSLHGGIVVSHDSQSRRAASVTHSTYLSIHSRC